MDRIDDTTATRKQCGPCWTICVIGVLGLVAGGFWVVQVVDMVVAGRGLERTTLFGFYAPTYIEALVFVCVAASAVLVAAYLNLRDYLLWRDLERKYGGKKPNPAPQPDGREASRGGQSSSAPARGRDR